MRTEPRAAQVFGFLFISILLRSTISFAHSIDTEFDQVFQLSERQDVLMAENPKYDSPLDVEKYAVAPSQLELEQVHIYVRHGERTPVGIRLTGPPANLPEHWMMCKTARRLQASVNGSGIDGILDEFQQARRIVERADGTHREGECMLGELTDLGRKLWQVSSRDLCRQVVPNVLKSSSTNCLIRIARLGLLPNILQNTETVYFRTTNVPRTTESLQQIIHGLYPTSKCYPQAIPPIFVRNGRDENLLGNAGSCKRLEILLVGFAQAAASAYNHTLEPLDKKLSKYIDGRPVRVDGKPRASGILDTIRAATAHNIKVPSEFEEKGVMDIIEKAVVAEWFSGYKTDEVRRLGMGRLLDDLATKMQQKVAQGDRDPLKIAVHSTHDTALAGLTSTLDVFDDK
ncbi:hypothetical protein D9757_003824 [Collybiopsis confluens]|uniref:Phosphoglycerate mutase-like protein n=1 Tax=Collybiopsis confluens TaxID=2823264 RepID=A0A8H5MDL8_9AGAR|nr:hypothetical protein D9757_003824 [Collybiopsis confluens]